MEDYSPIIGKTYTLFGKGVDTSDFYDAISNLADDLMAHFCIIEEELLFRIRTISKKKWPLNPGLSKNNISFTLSLRDRLHGNLSAFVPLVEDHLRTVPVYKYLTDRGLLTTRDQYYVYMLEFELVNRLNKKAFLESDYKLALLPYCLRDTQMHCKAETDDTDYLCQGCRPNCFVYRMSQTLKRHHVKPYIWRQARLKVLLRRLMKRYKTVGIMGIACIVELVAGMRLVEKSGLPVIGIPLNANRCIRWTDGFYENSVDLEQLEKLLEPAS
jgi:hypothetical protein